MGFDIFEIILILAVALMVLGPDQMPAVIRAAAKVLRDVRAASNEVMRELTEAMDETKTPAPPMPSSAPRAVQKVSRKTGELRNPVSLSAGQAEDKTGQ